MYSELWPSGRREEEVVVLEIDTAGHKALRGGGMPFHSIAVIPPDLSVLREV